MPGVQARLNAWPPAGARSSRSPACSPAAAMSQRGKCWCPQGARSADRPCTSQAAPRTPSYASQGLGATPRGPRAGQLCSPIPSLPIPICCTALGPVANELCGRYRGCCLNPNGLVSQGPILPLPLPPCLAFASIPIKSLLSLVEPLLSSRLSDNS